MSSEIDKAKIPDRREKTEKEREVTMSQERKQRSDKGLIMATKRDLYCIAWIAEQYAARFDQIQKLLSRFPDQHKPFKDGKLMAETTTKDVIARWQRAGWVEYRRVLADGRGYAWVTRRGLQLVGLDETFTARAPASTRLFHIYAVNQVRLWMDLQGFDWTSERHYKASLEKGKKGQSIGPVPDAVIVNRKNGARIAVEVEISAKKPVDLVDKLKHLAYAMRLNDHTLKHEHTYPAIWFYVPSEQMKVLVEVARSELRPEDQRRVSAALQPDLIA
jgi:hypothetical protein